MLAVGVALACAVSVPIAGAATVTRPTQPDPRPLWDAYPLNPAPGDGASRTIRGTSTTHAPAPKAARPDTGSGRSSWLFWLLLSALLVIPVAGAMLALGKRIAAARRADIADPSSASPTEETLILKRKAAAAESTETAKLRAKTRPSRTPERAAERDNGVLKAKLADPPRKLRAAEKPAPTAVAPAPGPARPRPAPTHVTAPGTMLAAPPVCRIDWWRGYVRSEFYAMLRGPDGRESVILRSPQFRWGKSTPPPEDLAEATAAHAALVSQLQAEGWVQTDRGYDWYSLELQRRPTSVGRPVREGAA